MKNIFSIAGLILFLAFYVALDLFLSFTGIIEYYQSPFGAAKATAQGKGGWEYKNVLISGAVVIALSAAGVYFTPKFW